MDYCGRNDSCPEALEKVIGGSVNENLKRESSFAQFVHEAFLSLNIGFSVTFVVLAFAYGGQGPNMSAGYFLLPGEHLFVNQADKINRLLDLYPGSDTGREITSCASILLIALSVYLVLLLIARTTLARPVLYALAARGRTPFVRMAQQITEIATILVRRPSWD